MPGLPRSLLLARHGTAAATATHIQISFPPHINHKLHEPSSHLTFPYFAYILLFWAAF